MGSSRRNEEPLQFGGPLSSSHQQESQSDGPGRQQHGGGKGGRKGGAQDHTASAPGYDPSSCYRAYRAAIPAATGPFLVNKAHRPPHWQSINGREECLRIRVT